MTLQVLQQGTEPGLAQEPQTPQGRQDAAATPARLERQQPWMVLTGLKLTGQVRSTANQLLQVGLVAGQKEAGDTRGNPVLWKSSPTESAWSRC